MNRYVLKYGGKSVATIEKMKSIGSRIIERVNQGEKLVIVLSAMSSSTNSLIELAQLASKIPNKRELDLLLSTGEMISIALMSMILNEMGCKAVALTGFQAGIITKGEHTRNSIIDIDVKKIDNLLKENKVVVVAGFQGINAEGDITTLGRGGSDTTAVAIAAKLKCPCEIYTDVDGVYFMDPKEYCKAKKIENISYKKMKYLAYLGAKVMEPRSIVIGEKFNVLIKVTNGEGKGTNILKDVIETEGVNGLAINDNLTNVHLNLNKTNHYLIIDELVKAKLNLEQINYSKSQISFIVTNDDMVIVDNIVSKYPNIKMLSEKIVKVSLVGDLIRNNKTILEVINLLNDNSILYKEISLLEESLSIITFSKLKGKLVETLAKHFNI